MAIKTKNKPQALLSKNMIMEALLTLMEEKNYDKITIKDITTKAQLSRRTFYRNFDTKDDVFELLIKVLVKEYTDKLIKDNATTLDELANLFFSFWTRKLKLLKLLEKSNLMERLLKYFNKYVPIIHEYAFKTDSFSSSENRKEAIYMITGGFWNILCYWLNEGAEKTPEEMAEAIKEFVDCFKYCKLKKIRYKKADKIE